MGSRPLDPRHRIFTRSSAPAVRPIDFHANLGLPVNFRMQGRDEAAPLWNALDVQEEADRVLISRYTPVGVLADESMTVLQFRGRTSTDLEPAPGMASLDLFRMLREGLLAEVRSATTQSNVENLAVAREGLRITDGVDLRQIRVEVIPFRVPPSGLRFFLIRFQDDSCVDRPLAPAVSAPVDAPPTSVLRCSSRRSPPCASISSR